MATQAPATAVVGYPVGHPASPGGTCSPSKEQASTSRGDRQPPRAEFVFWLCATSALEGVDAMLLPSSQYALQMDIGLTLDELVALNLVQGLALSLSAPVWGFLADQGLVQRRVILICGCFGWGLATGLLAFIDSWAPMVVLRIFHGAMLACLRPTCNAMVADTFPEIGRGKVFGMVQTSYDVGVMVTTLVATPLSTIRVFGLQGWRATFSSVCLLSMVLGFLLICRLEEPPRESSGREGEKKPKGDAYSRICHEARRILRIFRTPTFLLILAQGVFGFVPWCALTYVTLFFQTAGLTGFQAGFLTSASTAAQAIGHLMGGYIGDAWASRWPYHGRPLVAQFSAAVSIPFVLLLFNAAAPGPGAFGWYLASLVCLGLLGTWQLAGATLPMMADVVPPESRSTVVAWDTAIEGASGAVLGGPFVALLARHVFGYDLHASSHGVSVENAAALGKALSWVASVPFAVCFAFSLLTHWSYPADVQRLRGAIRDKDWEQDKIVSV